MEEEIKNLLNNVPSDVIARANKLINTRAGQEMIKEIQEKGINREMIENLIKPNQKVFIIRPNGIVKSRLISLSDECPSILHATTPIKVIKDNCIVWYDSHIKTVNKKASKWLGFNVGGVVVVIGDLEIK